MLDNLSTALEFLARTERTSSNFREKRITAQGVQTTNPQIHRPRFFPCAIATINVSAVKFRELSLLKPEAGGAVAGKG